MCFVAVGLQQNQQSVNKGQHTRQVSTKEKAMKVEKKEVVKAQKKEKPKMKEIKEKKHRSKIGLLKDKKVKSRIELITFSIGGLDRFTPTDDDFTELLGKQNDDGVWYFRPINQGTFTPQYLQLCAVVLTKCVKKKLAEIKELCKENPEKKKALKFRDNCSGGWVLENFYGVKKGKFKQVKLIAESLCWDEQSTYDWLYKMKDEKKITFMCPDMYKSLNTKIKAWRKRALTHNEIPKSPLSFKTMCALYKSDDRTAVLKHMEAIATQSQNV